MTAMRLVSCVIVVAACGGPPPSAPPAAPSPAPAASTPVVTAPLGKPGEPLAPRPGVGELARPADPVIGLYASNTTTCAHHASGAVTCWGGAFETPHRIAGWTDITALAFRGTLCAIHRDGRVECSTGEPTIDGDVARLPTRAIAGARDPVEIATNAGAVCVREKAGGVACRLGTGDFVPTKLADATSLAMATLFAEEWQFPTVSFACALDSTGRVACIDLYVQAQQDPHDPRKVDDYLAPAGKAPKQHVGAPQSIGKLAGATAIAASEATLCATTAAGKRCYRLGDHAGSAELRDDEPRTPCRLTGSTAHCELPYQNAQDVSVEGVRQVVAGYAHACALTANGAVACWGDDEYGELGRGVVEQPNTQPAWGLNDAVEIASWTYGMLALRVNGQLAYWGHGNSGKPPPADLPVTFSDLTDATHLVAGHFHACALRRSGRVACWGGRESFTDAAPKDVPGLTDVKQLRATDFGILARTADGRLLHAGDPYLGANAAADAPKPIAGAERAAAVVVAGYWLCVLDKAPGPVRCWAETKHWATEPIEVARDAVDLAGASAQFIENTPEKLSTTPDRYLQYPEAQLVVRKADGEAVAVKLGIDAATAKPAASSTSLATNATSLFTDKYLACARGPDAVACVSGDRFPAIPVPREYLDAKQLAVASPACVLRNGQVTCLAGDATMLGTGLGNSDVAVPVTFR